MTKQYQPNPEDKFAYNLWKLRSVVHDPFGDAVRPARSRIELVHLLAGWQPVDWSRSISTSLPLSF